MQYTDMIGYDIALTQSPQRIVSLVPSQTELLYDLGLEERVVGITKFCIHPESWFRSKERIGGTKTVHIDKVAALQPDLIIANKEENTKADIEQLRAIAPVWTSDILNLEDSLEMIAQLGAITSTEGRAQEIVANIRKDFSPENIRLIEDKRVAYFIWYQPLMSAGSQTFLHDILSRIGFINVYATHPRYPETQWQELQAAAPDYILLSSEPFPFKEKHLLEFKDKLPNATVLLVDGELFSWYGSRLLASAAYFKKIFSSNLSH
ncbi:MAG: cobalamin-binding protein [Bacteroidetes bacterium 43-16]|nr:MAG: cobalamin-binding protein [Bacteroidetes bacterium 43-16]